MDDIILIIQITAFLIITSVMILNVPLDPDKIEKDDKNEIISFLDLAKKIIPNEDLANLEISVILHEEYSSKIPERYRDYIYFFKDDAPASNLPHEPQKENHILSLIGTLVGAIIISLIINLLYLIPLISLFAVLVTFTIPYSVYYHLKEGKRNIRWFLLVHPNERTNAIFWQFFTIFFFLSLFITPILFYKNKEQDSTAFDILLFLSIYPIMMCLYLFFYKMYYQYHWKKQWNRIFSLIVKKTIDNQDLFNYTIAKDYQNKIDNYSVFPLGDKTKIYIVTMGLIQTTIYIFYKIIELGKPYLHLI